ncbi:putative AP2 protein [Hordeum vulgare]|nr:putative AP2 protein [Hordeum vulgare]
MHFTARGTDWRAPATKGKPHAREPLAHARKGSALPLPRATAPRSLSLCRSPGALPPPQSAATAPARRPRRATMSPCRRSASGYRGVRQRPNGGFYAEIRFGDLRISLGTYDTMHEAARAFDAAAWRLGRPRLQMNFPNVHTL